jgi:hypothetical protein
MPDHYALLREIYDLSRAVLLGTEATARKGRVLDSLTTEDERILRRIYAGEATVPTLAFQAGQSSRQVGLELTRAGRTVAHISMRRAAAFASWLSAGLNSEDLAVTARTLGQIVALTRRYSQREDSHYP